MDKAISIFIEVFTKNPLTVTLAVLGAICVVLAIIGRIPPMDIRGIRAVILGVFGAVLIGVAIALAWLLAASPAGQSQPEPITNAQRPTLSSDTRSVATAQEPITQATAPPTEPTASTPKGKYPCPLVVARSQVAAWKVGQTTVVAVDKALNEFAALRPNDAGAFVANTQIPNGVLIATDFGEATGWTRYPVTPVIHSGGWGLFESTGEYTAPKPGACMTIGP